MNFKNLLVEKSERYAVITINRPDKLNALNTGTIEELEQAMQALNEDEAIRAIILTGTGEKAFIAGADISQITSLNSESGKRFALRGQKVFRYVEKMKKPVIAAINGFALGGGCELAMACHIRLASSKAKFGQPEIKLGIIPGYGGTQRLPRLIGLSNALQLLLTGEMINAEDALRLGLVSEVVEPEQLMGRAKTLASQLAAQAPLAVHYILETVYGGVDTDLESALGIEAEYFGKACATEDMKEGTTAFLEKRAPVFSGK
jgi:enoyl-CoA hydratase